MEYFLLNEPFRYLKYQYKSAAILFKKQLPITLNHEATWILSLCNGCNTEEDIIMQIIQEHGVDKKLAKKYVSEFLQQAEAMKLVTKLVSSCQKPVTIHVLGSTQYWTPSHLALELTYNCPLRCKHCFVSAGTGPTMDVELIRSILSDVKELGILSVQLTGGEPLLHPYFKQIVSELLDSGLSVNVTTSGYVNSGNSAEVLKRITAGKGYVQVSLDGETEYHNTLRGRSDAFQRTTAFIREMVNSNVVVKVAFCCIDQSLEEMDAVCLLVKNLGAHSIKFGTVDEKGRAEENRLVSNRVEQKKIHEYIVSLKEKYEDAGFKVEIDDTYELPVDTPFQNCGCGYNMLKVDPNGYVTECIFSTKRLGRITAKYGLSSFLRDNAEQMQNCAKKQAPCKEICGDCEKLYYCKGCIVKAREQKCKNSKLFS